jgi:hypothetical protein
MGEQENKTPNPGGCGFGAPNGSSGYYAVKSEIRASLVRMVTECAQFTLLYVGISTFKSIPKVKLLL